MEPNPSPFRPTTSSRPLVEKDLSYTIVGAFFEVYNELGFGYLESIYAAAMEVALTGRGLMVQRELPVVVQFRGVDVGQHRLDMLVERRVILEIKSTEKIADHAKRQLRNYLTATGIELGIILHFGPTAQSYRVLGTKKAEPWKQDSAPLPNSDAGCSSNSSES